MDKISTVYLDGQVVLKVIKHFSDESGSSEPIQGYCLGMPTDDRMEVTNCFPFPKIQENDIHDQIETTLKNMRHINIDYLHVGWYISSTHGSFINRNLLEVQYGYQELYECIVLVYDPLKTSQGNLCFKAFKLSRAALEACRAADFSPQIMRSKGLSFENVFEELQVILRNSHLTNVVLSHLEDKLPVQNKFQNLSLLDGDTLKKQMRLLMESVDELNTESNRYNNFMRQLSKQQATKDQFIAKRRTENQQRQARGEPLLPEDEVDRLFKPLQTPSRLDGLLTSAQIHRYCQQIDNYAGQNFSILFMSAALQPGATPPLDK